MQHVETYDLALLEMCKNLEEENTALTKTVESLKTELALAQKDSTANKLIPHYRLAIVR